VRGAPDHGRPIFPAEFAGRGTSQSAGAARPKAAMCHCRPRGKTLGRGAMTDDGPRVIYARRPVGSCRVSTRRSVRGGSARSRSSERGRSRTPIRRPEVRRRSSWRCSSRLSCPDEQGTVA
jgi:hypothetical protein